MFTSSLFLAGLFSSIFAGHITRHFGRKVRRPGWVGCVLRCPQAGELPHPGRTLAYEAASIHSRTHLQPLSTAPSLVPPPCSSP